MELLGDPLGLEPEEMIVLTLMSGVLGCSLGIVYVLFWQGTPAAIGVFGIAAGATAPINCETWRLMAGGTLSPSFRSMSKKNWPYC